MKKLLAIMSALVTGGLAIVSFNLTQLVDAQPLNWDIKSIKKLLAIISAFVTGSLAVMLYHAPSVLAKPVECINICASLN
jgi:hypothetical protein